MKRMPLSFFLYPLFFLFLLGCRNDMDKYYERPDYLRGNAYQYLQEKGNYTYFLRALEMANYSDALDGRGLYSVFAPDDAAFERYLAKKGVSSLEALNPDSLRLLVSYHLIEFSFNKNDFLAFSKTASAEEPEEGDGSCYKFETLAQEDIQYMKDPVSGREVKVFQQKKFLPVLSTRLFKKQESVDYEGDYKLFYPSIHWQGDVNKLYVANAAVTEAGIPLDNGYMYLIDEVVEPLSTVYNELSQSDGKNSFQVFRELCDRFAYMHYDADKTKNYAELGDSLFMFYHYLPTTSGEDLPDIACEWTVSENESDYEARLKYAYNCFAPTDEVLKKYIEEFWEGGGHEYQELPLLNLYYLLKSHLANRETLILPSKIDKGLEGYYGEEWNLERKNILKAKMCSNGVFYGIDKVLEPAMYSMVMKPLFQYGRFNTMLNVGHKQGTFTTMVDTEREYTIFAIADGTLKEQYGYYADDYGNPSSNDPINGRVIIKRYMNEEDKTEVTMRSDEQADFINNQIVTGYVDPDQRGSKRIYYPTKRQYHFIYTEEGVIYGENGTAVNPMKSWKFDYKNGNGRGVVYEVDDKFNDNEYNVGMYLFQTSRYQKFYEALLKANLLELLPKGVDNIADVKGVEIPWMKNERCILFAPTNDAWDETQIPTDSVELNNFLKYFFIPLTENKITDYILPNYGVTGTFDTRHAYTPAVKAKMSINFVDDKRLRITNEAGTSVLTDDEVPYFATDGLVFGITKLIRAGN